MAFAFLRLWFLAVPVLAQLPRPAAQCPGYRATNVLQGSSYLVADLVLIGNCSSHSQDVEHLRLRVEYQTGKADHLHVPVPTCN
jgi:alpha-glucosidase